MGNNDEKKVCTCDEIGEGACPRHTENPELYESRLEVEALRDALTQIRWHYDQEKERADGLKAKLDLAEAAKAVSAREFHHWRARYENNENRVVHLQAALNATQQREKALDDRHADLRVLTLKMQAELYGYWETNAENLLMFGATPPKHEGICQYCGGIAELSRYSGGEWVRGKWFCEKCRKLVEAQEGKENG